MIRKKHNASEKARIVLEVLRGENTVNEIATKNNITPALLTRWKTQAIQGLPQVFERDVAKTRQQAEDEKEKDDLYKQIGKLTTQVEWLKKKAGY